MKRGKEVKRRKASEAENGRKVNKGREGEGER